jgi:hypothetical protein
MGVGGHRRRSLSLVLESFQVVIAVFFVDKTSPAGAKEEGFRYSGWIQGKDFFSACVGAWQSQGKGENP